MRTKILLSQHIIDNAHSIKPNVFTTDRFEKWHIRKYSSCLGHGLAGKSTSHGEQQTANGKRQSANEQEASVTINEYEVQRIRDADETNWTHKQR